jgi:hypothetical protein
LQPGHSALVEALEFVFGGSTSVFRILDHPTPAAAD